jgi:hypothetical protein
VRSVGLWLLLTVLVILLLGLLFGGYRKGTKLSAPSPTPTSSRSVALLTAPCDVIDACSVA